jgi:hypothetical protein
LFFSLKFSVGSGVVSVFCCIPFDLFLFDVSVLEDALVLGLLSFTLPTTPPKVSNEKIKIGDIIGLDALKLLKDKNFASFIKGKHNFYYVKTDVYHNGKQITKGDGIPGLKRYGGFDIAGSINKAKKWLDNNGDKLISGKGYQYKST